MPVRLMRLRQTRRKETVAATAPADAGAADAIAPALAQGTAVAATPSAVTATVTPALPEARSAFDDLSLSQLLDVSVVSSKRSESIADALSSITVYPPRSSTTTQTATYWPPMRRVTIDSSKG
jgi:hypothetical protein